MDDIEIIEIFRICRTARCSSGCSSSSGHDEDDGWKQAGVDHVHLGGCALRWKTATQAGKAAKPCLLRPICCLLSDSIGS